MAATCLVVLQNDSLHVANLPDGEPVSFSSVTGLIWTAIPNCKRASGWHGHQDEHVTIAGAANVVAVSNDVFGGLRFFLAGLCSWRIASCSGVSRQ